MKRETNTKNRIIRTLLLGGTATIALALAPVEITSFDLSLAEAAGGNGHGSGGGKQSGRDESRGGGASEERGEGRDERMGGSTKATDKATTFAAPQAVEPKGGSADRGSPPPQAKRGKTVVTTSDDDSDRPSWAGSPGGKDGAGGGRPDNAGSTKGDLFGDLWVILRDPQGVPVLTEEGWVQPLDEFGNVIELDEEGHPLDESLTIEVEMGRLNVGRAPTSVLDRRTAEVIDVLAAAEEITTDAAGRLVLTIDGELKTIDSPLENLAIYVDLLTTGSIGDLDTGDLVGTDFDFLVDGAYTEEDLAASTAFLAGATDKTGEFSIDEIAYINAFLGIEIEKDGDTAYSMIDYSTFTYDREATFDGVTAEVLVLEGGVWVPKTVDIYDEVFDTTQVQEAGTLEAYTVAAEDARKVIEFIHEYEVPVEELGNITH